MNIDLARTFLEIAETGNFNKAADRLDVTQSTVSMRIKALEDELGRPLFKRGKAGTELTLAGQQFRRYAATLVRVWEQARHEVALPPGYRAALTVGGQFSLWDRLLLRWIPWMRAEMPNVALRVEVGLSDGLMRQLAEGLIDLAVMYSPQSRPGFVTLRLLEEHLVLVSTTPRELSQWDADLRIRRLGAGISRRAQPGFSRSADPGGLGQSRRARSAAYSRQRRLRLFPDAGGPALSAGGHAIPRAECARVPPAGIHRLSRRGRTGRMAVDRGTWPAPRRRRSITKTSRFGS